MPEDTVLVVTNTTFRMPEDNVHPLSTAIAGVISSPVTFALSEDDMNATHQ